MPRSKTIIGRFEKLRFLEAPELLVKAKVDTGAKTSSVHVGGIKEIKENDKVFVEFNLLANKELVIRKSIFTKRLIKSSNGQKEERYVVELPIIFGGKKFKTEFSLSKRKEMQFEVLLGRQFLQKGFIVDVTQKYSVTEGEL